MRPDQLERLADMAEKLADAFLLEADPGEWPGNGAGPADLTQQERGDRYWCKKNAMATGGLLRVALDLAGKHLGEPEDKQQDWELDRQIAAAEKRAAAAVEMALKKARKRGSDERTIPKR